MERGEGARKRERERGGIEVMNISNGGIEEKVRHGVAQLAERSPSCGFESTKVSSIFVGLSLCSLP